MRSDPLLFEAGDSGGGGSPFFGGYILVGRNAIPEPDMHAWATWMETADRNIANNYYQCHGRRIWVSTVFLGIDHNLGGEGPLLFETMVFDAPIRPFGMIDLMMDRYATYAEAEAGHEATLARAKVEILGCRSKW